MEKYFADVKKFAVFLREKKLGEITPHDLQDWIDAIPNVVYGEASKKSFHKADTTGIVPSLLGFESKGRSLQEESMPVVSVLPLLFYCLSF